MRFIILLIPFSILSIWTWTATKYLYREIFLYQTLVVLSSGETRKIRVVVSIKIKQLCLIGSYEVM
jgi:hypothetical protein